MPQALQKYVREQIVELINILNKKTRVKGSLIDLEASISLTQDILGYYFKNPKATVDLVDDLLKMAIEAGTYCARGLLRALKEIHDALKEKCINSPEHKKIDPLKNYELKIMTGLQKARAGIADSMYQKYIEFCKKFMTGQIDRSFSFYEAPKDSTAASIAQDIHTADAQRKFFTYGFLPMSSREENAFSLIDVFMWGHSKYPYVDLRKIMAGIYRNNLEAVIQEQGMLNFTSHIRSVIYTNSKLTSDEQHAIMELLCLNEKWNYVDAQRRFMRLFLYIIGVIRLNPLNDVVFVDKPNEFSEENIKLQDLGSDWVVVKP